MNDRLTLLDESVDTLGIAFEMSKDGGDIFHSAAILLDLRRGEFLDERTFDFVILKADFLLGHFEFT